MNSLQSAHRGSLIGNGPQVSLCELVQRFEVWALFVLAAFLRFALAARGIDQLGLDAMLTAAPDAKLYLSMAQALLTGSEAYEHGFFTFGPGHAWYLAGILWLSDGSLWAVLLTNLTVSSLACVLVYAFAHLLVGSRVLATIAGLLCAVSITGIELSAMALSENPFVFVFALGNILFLLSIRHSSFALAASAGVGIGAAVLIRPIAQFWPAIMVLWVVVLTWPDTRATMKSVLRSVRPYVPLLAVSIGIPILVVLSWSARNLDRHGSFALAFSSAGGPANIAAMAVGNDSDEYYRDITTRWLQECRGDRSWDEFPIGERFDCLRDHTNDVLRSDPFGMMGAWLSLTWENLNDITYLHRSVLPEDERQLVRWEYGVKDKKLQYFPLILVLLGLGTLLVRGRFGDMVLLGSFLVYFALLIGFTKYQGSRLIYPAFISGDILIALAATSPILRLVTLDSWRQWRIAFRNWFQRGGRVVRSSIDRLYVVHPTLLFVAVVIGIAGFLFRDFVFSNAMLYGFDTINAGIFFRSFLVNHVHQYGCIPLWNPYIFAGLPFVDAFHGDIFYPLSVIKFFGDLYRMLGWILILHVVLAAVTMFITSRELGINRLGSAFSGLVYMLAPYTVSFVAAGHDGKLFVTALFPLLVFFTHRLFHRRPVWNATWLGVTIGVMILTPHPQLSYYALLVLVAYGLYQIVDAWRRGFKWLWVSSRVGLMIAAVVLGLGIASIQMLPGVLYTTADGPRSTVAQGYHWASSWSMHVEELISLAIPGFPGVDSPVNSDLKYWGRNSFKDNSESTGAVALFIGLLGVLGSQHRQARFWAFTALVTLIYALGDTTPLFVVHYYALPFIGKFRAPATAMFIFLFSIAFLGGSLLQGLLDRRPTKLRHKRVFRGVLWGLPLMVTAVALFFLVAQEAALTAYAYCCYDFLLSGSAAAQGKLRAALAYLPSLIKHLFVTALFLWLAALVVRQMLLRKRIATFAVVLCALVAIEGIWFDRRFVATIDYSARFNDNPLVEFFESRNDLDRAQGVGYNIHARHVATHGVMGTLGYHGNEPNWYRDLIHHKNQFIRNYFNGRFLNLLNVGYIVRHVRGAATVDPPVGPEPLDTLGIAGDAIILRNHYRFPRAFLVGSYEVLESRTEICEQVLNSDVDLRQLVYLESEPELKPQPPSAPDSAARITDYTPNMITVATSADRDQLLVLTDNWYHAWEVFVDGEKAVLQRAYGSFRVVAVHAGQHEVLFRYNPERYHRARLITIVSVVVAVGVLGASGYRHFRRRRRE